MTRIREEEEEEDQPYSDHRDVTVVKSQAILKLLHTSHKSQSSNLKGSIKLIDTSLNQVSSD